MAQDRKPTNRWTSQAHEGAHGAGLRGARNRTDRAEAPPASIAASFIESLSPLTRFGPQTSWSIEAQRLAGGGRGEGHRGAEGPRL